MENEETQLTEQIPPFGGRQTLIAWLRQNLLETTDQKAFVIIGREGMGKSAFLKQFEQQEERTLVGTYLQLSADVLANDETLSRELTRITTYSLDTNGFGLSRLPEKPEEDFPTWFDEQFLPEVFHILRAHRRLVWLFDDAEQLLHSEETQTKISYLHNLLKKHEQLRIVLSINTAYENLVDGFGDFVNTTQIQRLRRLSDEESEDLIRQFTNQPIDESVVKTIGRLTGGFPRLLQAYGEAIRVQDTALTTQSLQTITQKVYEIHQEDFRQQWLELEQDERLVLTAVSSLLYRNPNQTIKPSDVETWLVETDYPLALRNINAALRSLEYRELILSSTEGIQYTTGLMQQWLVQNARLDNTVFNKSTNESPLSVQAVILIVLIFAVLIAVISMSMDRLPSSTEERVPEPTITFEQAP